MTLGAFWGVFGGALGPIGLLLGSIWTSLGTLGHHLAPNLVSWGLSGSVLSHFGGSFGVLGVIVLHRHCIMLRRGSVDNML